MIETDEELKKTFTEFRSKIQAFLKIGYLSNGV